MSKTISLTLDDEIYSEIEKLASQEDRSISATIRVALKEKINRSKERQMITGEEAPRAVGRPRTKPVKLDQEGYHKLFKNQLDKIDEADFVLTENGMIVTYKYSLNPVTGARSGMISSFQTLPAYLLDKIHPEIKAKIEALMSKAEKVPTKDEVLAERAKEGSLYIKPEEIAEKSKEIRLSPEEVAKRTEELNKENNG